jgi:hypothetical protein
MNQIMRHSFLVLTISLVVLWLSHSASTRLSQKGSFVQRAFSRQKRSSEWPNHRITVNVRQFQNTATRSASGFERHAPAPIPS